MYRTNDKTWVITEKELSELYGPVDLEKLYSGAIQARTKIVDNSKQKISKQRTFNSDIDRR